MDLQDREAEPRIRRVEYRDSMTIYHREYLIPHSDSSGLCPAVGDAVTVRDVTGANMLQPRILSIGQGKQVEGAMIRTPIAFYQLRTYGALPDANLYTELRGSRVTRESGSRLYADRLFASKDGNCQVLRADMYPDDEENNYTRVAITPHVDKRTMPGLFYHRITYVGFIPYDDDATSEIKGSRRTWGSVQRRYGERMFVTIDGNCGVSESDAFPGDQTIQVDARLAAIPVNTPDVTPGRILTKVLYEGVRIESD